MAISWNPRSHYKNSEVAASYDRIRFLSMAGRAFDRLEKRALLRALRDVPKGLPIADIPCGTGRLAEALLKAGYRVTGTDISQAMLDQAALKLASFGSRFLCKIGDATHLIPPEEPFAAALCARVLMHFPLDQQIEFLRGVSTQTNKFVIFNQSYNSTYQRIRRRIKRLLRHRVPVAHPLTERELQRLLKEAGLQELRRVWVAPLISEAFFVVAVKASDTPSGPAPKGWNDDEPALQ